MSDTQNERGHDCRRPKTNGTCQSELRVSPNREFLGDAGEYEYQRPQYAKAQQRTGWQLRATEIQDTVMGDNRNAPSTTVKIPHE